MTRTPPPSGGFPSAARPRRVADPDHTPGVGAVPPDLAGPSAHGRPYAALAAEYDGLLGPLAERTWRQGILADIVRLGITGPVVDLGAGTGIGGRLLRTVLPHACLVGVDVSAVMLDRATGGYDRTVVADLRHLPEDLGPVGSAVAGFDTLNYLDALGLAACLRQISRHLRAGGWLVFDYSSPHLLRRVWREDHHVQDLPDGRLVWQHRFDPAGQRSITTLTRHHHGVDTPTWHETHVQHALDVEHLHTAALAADLHVVRVRDLHRDQFSPAVNTHVWALRKPETR